MKFNWTRAAIFAALLFAALFLFRFVTSHEPARMFDEVMTGEQVQSSFENSRKNYASFKMPAAAAPGLSAGDVQKYEKVGTLTQSTTDFDTDKKKLLDLTSGHQGVIQLERATGLKGHQVLSLGIGVPPDKFDAFIAAAKAVGKSVQIDVVKNDKTNEYLQLKAKRATLEKARAALEDLKTSGGSVDERVNILGKLTDIEDKIQELGVSLGEFDTQNELCTVKLTLREARSAPNLTVTRRAVNAFEWAAGYYAMLAAAFLCLIVSGWLAAGLASFVLKLVRQARMA